MASIYAPPNKQTYANCFNRDQLAEMVASRDSKIAEQRAEIERLSKAPYMPEVIDDIEANSFYESFNMSMHNGEPLKIAIPKALKVMIKPVQNNLSKP